MRIPFAIHSSESRSKRNSRQRLINAYAVPEAEGAKEVPPVFGTPGIKAWTTAGEGLLRCSAKFEGSLYVVSGTTLYRIKKDGEAVEKGVVPGVGRLSVAVGESLLFGNGYYYDGTVKRVNSPSYQGSRHVAWLAGFYIYLKPNTDVFYVSQIEDPGTIDPDSWATAETSPDGLVTMLVDHNDLLLFGTDTVEIWGLSQADFPFQRHSNGVIELGCGAEWSPAKIDNSVFWFADDKTVRVLRGVTPEKVSSTEMDEAVQKYATTDDAFGTTATVAGRATYTLTFPSEGATWQFSVNTGLWNELSSYDKGRWRVDHEVNIYGKNLVLDGFSAKIGELDLETYSEWGDILPFIMQSAPVHNGNKWLYFSGIWADFETGGETVVDSNTGGERDAQVAISWTDDGRIWSDEYWRSIGRVGNHSGQVAWHQNTGRSKNRTYRMLITDPVYRHFLGADLEGAPGGY